MKTIVLTGMMGAGKTSAGKILAQYFGAVFKDLDYEIEKSEGCPIFEIFETKGERYFREAETRTLKEIFSPCDMVLSLGGGTFENVKTREFLLENANVFYLETSPCEIFRRIKTCTNRPLLKDNMTVEKIKEILNKRKNNYKLASNTILTDNKTVEQIAKEISECVK